MFSVSHSLCPILQISRYMLLKDGTRIDSFDDRQTAEMFARIYNKNA
jgi:hypothetical protein